MFFSLPSILLVRRLPKECEEMGMDHTPVLAILQALPVGEWWCALGSRCLSPRQPGNRQEVAIKIHRASSCSLSVQDFANFAAGVFVRISCSQLQFTRSGISPRFGN